MTKLERYGREVAYWCLRYLALRSYLTAPSTVMGMRFRFRTADAIGRNIYKRGAHEPDVTAFFQQLFPRLGLKPGDAILDVGANLGWYAVLFDRLSPPGARVFSFEPDPGNFELLTHNVGLNGCTKVCAAALGASDHEGTATLYVYPNINRGKHSMLPTQKGHPVQVPVRRLDDYLGDQGVAPERVKLIKIDVEGYEYTALRGMARTLAAGPALVSELVPRYLRRAGIELEEYLRYISSFGYRPHLLADDGLQVLSAEDLLALEGNNDIIWLR